MRVAVLMNLGTPLSPSTPDVRSYLQEFLMDPHVIDIPFLWRWLLVHGAILPFRPARSAEAYRKIWTERGSPLRVSLEELGPLVQTALGEGWRIFTAMRYGQPRLREVAREIAEQVPGDQEVLIAPLYPQYALSSTESSIQYAHKVFQEVLPRARLSFLKPFYGDQGFIGAFSDRIQNYLKDKKKHDVYLFSFHGLPVRQVKKTEQRFGAHCLVQPDCCEKIQASNSSCYRAQCHETARLIAARLGWKSSQYRVSFQSRLGKTPWIEPFTDVLYEELGREGVKRLCVICPSFVSDCLETLEEVEIRGKEQFKSWGGEDLDLVPSLNSDPVWVQALSQLLLKNEGAQ